MTVRTINSKVSFSSLLEWDRHITQIWVSLIGPAQTNICGEEVFAVQMLELVLRSGAAVESTIDLKSVNSQNHSGLIHMASKTLACWKCPSTIFAQSSYRIKVGYCCCRDRSTDNCIS